MLLSKIILLGAIPAVMAQRPSNVSMCDYYTMSTFKVNNAASQDRLIARLFNEAVIGNYTTPNIGVPVAGFATPAFYNGSWVNLIQYFTGQLNCTNGGGSEGISRNFLDDGGPTPLTSDKPSNGNMSSYQYNLFTHAYSLWGELLGCSKQGSPEFPSYNGKQSMFEVHKFMNLDPLELGFFTSQQVLSAYAIGFSQADAAEFGDTIDSLFSYRCSPPRKIAALDAGPSSLQSCCLSPDCPIDPDGGDCSLYPDNGVTLVPVNITVTGNATTTANSSATTSAVPYSSDALKEGVDYAKIWGGVLFGILGVVALRFV